MTNVDTLRTQLVELMQQRGVFPKMEKVELPAVVPYPLIRHNLPELPYYSGYIPEGWIYDWDQYFEGILQIHAGLGSTYVANSVLYFLYNMQPDGFIPRRLPYTSIFSHNMAKPFLIQQALLTVKAGHDPAWLLYENFYRLKHYLNHWLMARDIRGAGLSVWDDSCHTGMDNHYERAGYLLDSFCEGVDLNCYIIRECNAFARLAELLDLPGEAGLYRDMADIRRKAVVEWCWDEQTGFLYDYDARRHRRIPVKYSGAFAALWAGVLDADQARRVVNEHLLNPDEFWRRQPIPGLAADAPGYVVGHRPGDRTNNCSWRAHSWVPVNYYVFQGLRQYGFHDAAAELAEKTEAMFCQNPFREYYCSDMVEGCGRDPFLGWSALALFMRQELERDIDMTAC